MSRQRVDVERLGGVLAGGWGRYRESDLMLAGGDGGGGGAGNAVVRTDQDAGSDLGHGGSYDADSNWRLELVSEERRGLSPKIVSAILYQILCLAAVPGT
jgi:hypothetical protein